jgi:hypothetical protein
MWPVTPTVTQHVGAVAPGVFQGVGEDGHAVEGAVGGDGAGEGFHYGSVLGRNRFNPSVGISFVFEAEDGMHRVVIKGSNLFMLHGELVIGRRESIRVGEKGAGHGHQGDGPVAAGTAGETES